LNFIFLASLLVIDMPTTRPHWPCPFAQEPHERTSTLCERGGSGIRDNGVGSSSRQGKGSSGNDRPSGNNPGNPSNPGGNPCGGNCGVGLGNGGGNGTGNEGGGQGPGDNGRPPQTNPGGAGGNS
jgi:hypothetical protein